MVKANCRRLQPRILNLKFEIWNLEFEICAKGTPMREPSSPTSEFFQFEFSFHPEFLISKDHQTQDILIVFVII